MGKENLTEGLKTVEQLQSTIGKKLLKALMLVRNPLHDTKYWTVAFPHDLRRQSFRRVEGREKDVMLLTRYRPKDLRVFVLYHGLFALLAKLKKAKWIGRKWQ